MLVLENFVDGQFQVPKHGRFLDSYAPATGAIYARVPDSTEEDVQLAVEAACRAFPAWSSTTRAHRSQLLYKVAQLLEDRLEGITLFLSDWWHPHGIPLVPRVVAFALAESQDQGKPVHVARTIDIPRAVYNFRYFAGKILYQEHKKTELDGVAINYTERVPVGVAGLISPWNLPLYLLTWKIAPALAAGDTCVCKPSELTSVTAYMLCSLLKDAGIPRGVVNMVFGNGPNAGNALVLHPDVPLISFTGGTVTGEVIMRNSAPYCKKLSLELGGKNPNIVFEDADLDACIATTVRSSFANQGEICLCGSRIFVHQSIYTTFLDRFAQATRKLVVGDPRDPRTDLGALVSAQHLEKVMGYVELAKKEGGKLVCGGSRLTDLKGVDGQDLSGGYFLQPTIIAGGEVDAAKNGCRLLLDPMTSRVMQEEIFGPVVTVTPFESEEQVVRWANGTKYGLSATVWTEHGRRQRRVASALRAGTVWVNCWMVRDLKYRGESELSWEELLLAVCLCSMPFGGMKMSGLGREGSDYSLEYYTEEKTICLAN